MKISGNSESKNCQMRIVQLIKMDQLLTKWTLKIQIYQSELEIHTQYTDDLRIHKLYSFKVQLSVELV